MRLGASEPMYFTDGTVSPNLRGRQGLGNRIPLLMKPPANLAHLTERIHPPPQVSAPFNPTLAIRAFREAVLGGDCPMPYNENVTEVQKLEHAAKLKDRALG